MGKVLGSAIAIVIIIIFAFPFAKEAFHRYEVSKRLDALMEERDRAAFRQWSGDAESFGRSLYERCEVVNGRDSPACEPIKAALR